MLNGWDIAVIFCVILYVSYRIYKRNIEDNSLKLESNKGCLNFGIIALMLSVLSVLSIPFVVMTVEGLVKVSSGETHLAEVVSIRSYEDKDDESNWTTMYVPTVSFTPANSYEPITHELSIASGESPIIGETHKIAYDAQTGSVQSKELSTILLLVAGLIFSLVLMSFVVYAILYSFNVKMPITPFELLIYNFIGILVPLSIIGMNAGLIYYLYQRLVNDVKADQRVWVMVVCAFFSLVLTLVTFGFFKLLINRKLFSTMALTNMKENKMWTQK